ncbi:RluA family pseudouridine synthase [Phaeocystidibacter luteus]|uniref:RluA family pseudouridine synthase n=1 Tax=Phaeocystidibacter luteus TaxID=911197 RepID=A0A6N6RMA9_9FLAO|nr:RluA family pseudouridine synthase [Phaeocystidibacter luteus]KAB2814696.1 RluA family pseudouridine synthase [Phaeocystidibacter luteus]
MSAKLDILYEDNHLVIINKRAGQIVQADATKDKTLGEYLADYIKEKYNKPGKVFIGIPHRLDRPTSGIVIFTRTSKGLSRMTELFKKREISKTYWAVTQEKPTKESGRLVDWVRKNPKQNKSYVVPEGTKGSQQAILNYSYLRSSDRYHLLEIDLETGRHHQIRTQLTNLGCHIKGDVKYGADRPNKDRSIHLHSRSVSFIHPIKNTPIQIDAEPPNDPVWNALK